MCTGYLGMSQLLSAREQGVVGSLESLQFQRSLHFPPYLSSKLDIEYTYHGHNGCVNRLAWNADGSLLVSGSDDRRAIIWHYPDVERPPLALTTEHRANLFGCQFLPCTGDRFVVTGAMDNTVQLHDLEASPLSTSPAAWAAARSGRQATGGGGGAGGPAMRRRVASPNLTLVTPRTKLYLSHKDRVKDVKVEALNPHNFWSGGEDGVVRQYDTRAPNQDKWESPTVLIQVRDGHRTVQVKSVDINKAHPHLMAVAGSDPYIRLYDRRKLSSGCWKRRGATPAILALAPPHLPILARQMRSHATYVSFSNRGDKVVTTYHGDHAYSFDITSCGDLVAMFPRLQRLQADKGALRCPPAARWVAAWGSSGGSVPGAARSGDGCGAEGGSRGGSTPSPLPPRAEEAKIRGNAAIFERNFTAAIGSFTDGLHLAPGAPILYALRADALLRRAWVGDAAMALRDCDTAVALDATCSRAFLSRIQALQALQQYQCALTAVDEYQRRFPGRASDEVASLMIQLRDAVEERRRSYEARRQQQERRRTQRAEALARAPRRMTSALRPSGPDSSSGPTGTVGSPAPREAEAAAPAATPTTAATHPTAATTTATATASKTLAMGGVPMHPDGAGAAPLTCNAVTVEPQLPEVSGADCSPAQAGRGPAQRGSERNGAEGPRGECPSNGDNDDDNDDDDDEMVGPPPPPPPLPQSTPASQDVPAQPAAGGAAGDASVASGSGAAPAGAANGSVPGASSASSCQAPGGNLDRGLGGAGAAASEAGLGPGPATLGEVEDLAADSVWEDAMEASEREEGEEVEVEVEAGGVLDRVAGAPGEQRGLEAGEDEEEELRGQSDSGDDSEAGSLYGEGSGEEDPDLELFLQFYARAMELAEGGTGTTGVRTPGSSGRPAGQSGEGQGQRPHLMGAWGGSPGGRRMLQRYVGQCNVQTDIKEVNYIGSDDRVVAAGSDCGRVFLYDADSGAVLRTLMADEDVANCVQCHPTLPVLATSGIENVVRLWSPRKEVPELQDEMTSMVVEKNQRRMKDSPQVLRPFALPRGLHENPQLLHLIVNQLYGRGFRGVRGGGEGAGGEDEDDEDEDAQPEVSCRMA